MPTVALDEHFLIAVYSGHTETPSQTEVPNISPIISTQVSCCYRCQVLVSAVKAVVAWHYGKVYSKDDTKLFQNYRHSGGVCWATHKLEQYMWEMCKNDNVTSMSLQFIAVVTTTKAFFPWDVFLAFGFWFYCFLWHLIVWILKWLVRNVCAYFWLHLA